MEEGLGGVSIRYHMHMYVELKETSEYLCSNLPLSAERFYW